MLRLGGLDEPIEGSKVQSFERSLLSVLIPGFDYNLLALNSQFCFRFEFFMGYKFYFIPESFSQMRSQFFFNVDLFGRLLRELSLFDVGSLGELSLLFVAL